MSKTKKVYVASSWRNDFQPKVVRAIRSLDIEVYDFKNPGEGDNGFRWSEVMPSYNKYDQLCDANDYLEAIKHPIAEAGYKSDWDAMNWADTFVLVLPCGRSAHLELGWAVGAGKKTCILLDGPVVTPELMYLMVDEMFVIPDGLADFAKWISA